MKTTDRTETEQSVQNQSENALGIKRDVMVYKHRQFEIVEVEKERIDNIKQAVDNARNNFPKGVMLHEVLLGFSTTFLGSFISFLPDVRDMLSSGIITGNIFFYFALLLGAVILFFCCLNSRKKSHLDTVSLIEKICTETDSISKNWVSPEIVHPELIPVDNRNDSGN